ncbi:MAG TPA: hypothetical protein VE131_13410 [Terriglobales bacterium]|nr:hypothetical protein [Terriglobales bacterium]
MVEEHSLSDQIRSAIEELERAQQLDARELKEKVDDIQRRLVQIRDQLIDRLRRAEASPVSGRRHAGLDRINMALSLIISAEYPVTSIKRSALEKARDALSAVVDNSTLPAC